jgi:uncharacterized protein
MPSQEKGMTLLPGSKGEHELQERFRIRGRACAFYDNQMLDHLNEVMRKFIARQEMVFIGSADSHGECDCSFRAGLPGFVHVLDEKALIYPEYTGNGVLGSLGNIHENPHVGMMFIDFFESTVGLHVNGRAKILTNIELMRRSNLPKDVRRDMGVKGGRKPRLWVLVEVEEAYIHCSKHIPLLKKLDKTIHWGTDNVIYKGGDYFQVKDAPRPWRASSAKGSSGGSCT